MQVRKQRKHDNEEIRFFAPSPKEAVAILLQPLSMEKIMIGEVTEFVDSLLLLHNHSYYNPVPQAIKHPTMLFCKIPHIGLVNKMEKQIVDCELYRLNKKSVATVWSYT